MHFMYIIYRLLFYFFRVFPIDNQKIVFSSYSGNAYGDNGKYISDELIRRGLDLHIVWLYAGNNIELFPRQVRVVKYRSLKSIYEQATAKVWIDNKRKNIFVQKRKGQFYIQTWHGGIGPKKIEKEAASQLNEDYVRRAVHDSKMIDLMIAESEWTYDLYKRAFWYNGEIAKCGVPREDILFNNHDELRRSLKKQLNIADDIRVVLYAPTFRKTINDISLYELDWSNILLSLHNRFGGKWIGFVRLHPNIAQMSGDLHHPDNVFDVSAYPDMQELLVLADCMITDYSSTIYEYGITKKPAFIYAPDFSDYVQERSLAINYNELPFPLAYTTDELVNQILKFDESLYLTKIESFYSDYLNMYDGGHASIYLADRILKEMKK